MFSVWALAVLAAGLAACGGKIAFFEVSIMVSTLVDRTMITSCELTVTGAVKDGPFTLANCAHVTSPSVGLVQYGTETESGSVSFHVDAFDGSHVKLGQGDATGPINAGGRTAVSLTIGPP